MNGQKLLIAGWDGATWEVLEPLLRAGKLPTLQKLIQQGSYGKLTSVIPPISAAAWVTVLTGVNPARHGVYDFRNLDLRRYTARQEQLASSASYQLPTLFDCVAERGAIAYQIPLTYPPRPLHGVLVAGYPTPNPHRAYTYPPEWADRLNPLLSLTADQLGRVKPMEQLNIYQRYVPALTDHLITLSQSVSWQLMFFVNGAIDGAQHHFFKYTLPHYPGVSSLERQRYGHLLAEVVQIADLELGRLLEQLPADINILLISDHGGRPRPTKAFHVNAWLRSQGWLQLKQGTMQQAKTFLQQGLGWAKERFPLTDWAKQQLPLWLKERLAAWRAGSSHINWQQTQAYRVKLNYPFEGIHLNLCERQFCGSVLWNNYYSLREKIMLALTQRPEVLAAYPREQLLHGDHLNNAPDILFQLHPDYDGGDDLQQIVSPVPPSWLKRISGYHDMDGILVAAGPAFQQGRVEGARLVDILPTALYSLGLEMPADLDGQPLTYLFKDSHPRPSQSPPLSVPTPIAIELTAEESAGMTHTLRHLGYI